MFKKVIFALLFTMAAPSLFYFIAFGHLKRIDPLPQTKQWVQQERYAEAEAYLAYFIEYDYVKNNAEAVKLYQHIQETRDGWEYQSNKILSGFITGESDEQLGQTAAVVSDFLVVGDIRDIYQQGLKLVEGEEINDVSAALSGLGLIASSTALLTAKPTLSFLKMAHKAGKIPNWLHTFLITSAEIAYKTQKINHITQVFNDIYTLSESTNLQTTLKLLESSKTVDDFHHLAQSGDIFGNKTLTLLNITENQGLMLYQQMNHKTSKKIFLKASTYGKEGVIALKRYGTEPFKLFLHITTSY